MFLYECAPIFFIVTTIETFLLAWNYVRLIYVLITKMLNYLSIHEVGGWLYSTVLDSWPKGYQFNPD